MPSTHHHTPDSVLQMLETLLPRLSCPPLTPTVHAQLSSLCVGLKQVGRLLEPHHHEVLDNLQLLLTSLCQDTSIDILQRLQLLEIIELRSLVWKTNPTVESYYRERFQKSNIGSQMTPERQERRRKLSQTPSLSSIPEKTVTESMEAEDFLVVRGVKLYIRSSDVTAVGAAKEVLKEFFSRENVPTPQVLWKH